MKIIKEIEVTSSNRIDSSNPLDPKVIDGFIIKEDLKEFFIPRKCYYQKYLSMKYKELRKLLDIREIRPNCKHCQFTVSTDDTSDYTCGIYETEIACSHHNCIIIKNLLNNYINSK